MSDQRQVNQDQSQNQPSKESGSTSSKIPGSGSQVVAMTYQSDEYEEESYEVTGVLSTRPSPFGDIPQCFVGDIQVDPASVHPAASPDVQEQR